MESGYTEKQAATERSLQGKGKESGFADLRSTKPTRSSMNFSREHRTYGKISVLIVDDHPLFRDGLQKALELEDDIEVIGQCADGEQALKAMARLQPSVVLLDINLPTINGLQVARQLKTERNNVSIVFLTAYHDSQQVLHAMRAGASAYCPKDIMPDELIEIIRTVAHGYYVVGEERVSAQDVSAWINANLEALSGSYIVDPDEHYIPLSPREVEILQFVTNGMSNKEIASRLSISQQTVKNHMTSILKKLNVQDRTQAAVTALRHGWVRIQSQG
jgi:DNA-binding NarL/FixJ family response regulator